MQVSPAPQVQLEREQPQTDWPAQPEPQGLPEPQVVLPVQPPRQMDWQELQAQQVRAA